MCGGGAPKQEGPSQEEIQTALDAQNDWRTYKQLYMPGENTLREQIRATPDRVARAEGMANVDAELQAGQVAGLHRFSTLKGAGAGGMVNLAGGSADAGELRGGAIAGADTNMQLKENQGLLGMIAHGRKLNDQRELGTQQAAASEFQKQSSMLDTALKNRQNMYAGIEGGLSAVSAGIGVYAGMKKGGGGQQGQEGGGLFGMANDAGSGKK